MKYNEGANYFRGEVRTRLISGGARLYLTEDAIEPNKGCGGGHTLTPPLGPRSTVRAAKGTLARHLNLQIRRGQDAHARPRVGMQVPKEGTLWGSSSRPCLQGHMDKTPDEIACATTKPWFKSNHQNSALSRRCSDGENALPLDDGPNRQAHKGTQEHQHN